MIRRQKKDMPLTQTELRDGEKILIEGHISDGIFWKAFGVLMMSALLLLIAIPLAVFLSIVALLAFLYAVLLKRFLLLTVTNHRIFFRSGLLKVDTVQVRLDRVESVEIQRTLMGQFLGYATVILTGVGSRYSFIPYLANATDIRNVIDDVLYQHEQHKG